MGARWIERRSTRPARRYSRAMFPPPMITTSLPAAAARALPSAPSSPSVTKVNRWARRTLSGTEWVTTKTGGADLVPLGAVAHVIAPPVRSVDEVERAPAHDDGTGRGDGGLEELGVARCLLAYRPRVQRFAAHAETVHEVGTGR